jgi:ABC-2 type transport system ATP-binding protein
MLELRGVTIRRRRRVVVEGLDLVADTGVVGLVGPNGSGKTSTLAAIAGVLPVATGEIVVDGVVLDRRTRAALTELIGYAPQSLTFPAGMTAAEVCAYAAWLRRVPPSEVDARVTEALTLAGLAERAGVRVGTLSGGGQRRLALAQALVHRPRLLLLDEPTSELDPEHRMLLRKAVAELSRDRLVLLSTHILEDLAALDATVVVMDAGRARFVGDVGELLAGRPDGSLEDAYRGVLHGVNG